eukprot:TRINITY_DN31666_c2_g1_i1.p1 TRINITY_DN31666_c2_g1~~TRINITY_DN31666_c2_g1_i1.p1  ORF type:complete len:671 (-),score=73.42 TRINITY_DN31666_c2_g1_i1:120-2045(-)
MAGAQRVDLRLLLFTLTALAAERVTLDLFVASKCPDAARCENALLPGILAEIGDAIDLRLGFIGEVNASAAYGVTCMHGDSECIGNAVQLCTEKHFPVNVNLDTFSNHRLNPRHVWTLFLQCVGHFNHTVDSQIPGNTASCLQKLGVPEDTIDKIKRCSLGDEGKSMLQRSIRRTLETCGHHSEKPGQGCKSCSVFVDGKRTCVVDDGKFYNCTQLGSDVEAWVDHLCGIARRKATDTQVLPLRCRVAKKPEVWIYGHAYASVDPEASAAFAERYFGAIRLKDTGRICGDGSREIEVLYPSFDDYRGGGLRVSFVHNPKKPGGQYDIAAFVKSMTVLYGNLSNNSGHHWNQFFDSHLGFYVPDVVGMVTAFMRDGVPFFTGLSSGLYESVYVAIPGTGKIVEVLGDYDTDAPLPANYIRFSSTQQFCTPKRRLSEGGSFMDELGVNYRSGDADINKTTFASADPDKAVEFAVKYLGASRIQQGRAPPADGQCAKLAWAQWPDGHQWHLVDAKAADWVSVDHMRPAVPFNISELAQYIEALRDLKANQYDQWLDYRDVFQVSDLSAIAEVLDADGVDYGIWGRPTDMGRMCLIILNIPKNGIAIELRSSEYAAPWLKKRCETSTWDLCSAGRSSELELFEFV